MLKIITCLVALILLIGIAFLLSENKKHICWQAVIVGLIGQIVLIAFVLRIPIGQRILETIAGIFSRIFELGMEGVNFVFGGIQTTGFVFAINVLALIIFTSALVSVLYYFKVIPFLIKYLGGAISKLLGTSKVETMACVSNMILGGSEAILVVKEHLPTISKSELFVCMSSGFASASVGILAGYVAMGFDLRYMLIAIFTVPFSCLMVSKILVPETEDLEKIDDVEVSGVVYENIFDAITSGSLTGVQVALAVGGTLIGFIGIIAILNVVLGLFGTSLSGLLGFIFMPFGYLLGIPSNEITLFSSILGNKIGVNEFVAFDTMAIAIKEGLISSRTVSILTTACTNFANFSVIGIVGSAIVTLAPERKDMVMQYGIKALIVGTLSTMLTATLVALMI